MIVGHGDIASVLGPFDRDDRIFFASGVSNSSEVRESEYQREIDLLLGQDRSKRLVYFGSLSIFYSKTRYAKHKLTMEDLVKSNFSQHTIMRLGNISWGKNPNTIINYLKEKISRGEPCEVQNVYRYVVDLGEFHHWLSLIPDFSCQINVVGRRMKVKDIINEFCAPTQRLAIYNNQLCYWNDTDSYSPNLQA